MQPADFIKATFHLADMSVVINTTGLSVRLWMDAAEHEESGGHVLRVSAKSEVPRKMRAKLEVWRKRPQPWGPAQQGYKFYCPWSTGSNGSGVDSYDFLAMMPPDVLSDAGASADSLIVYHRNEVSSFRSDLDHQVMVVLVMVVLMLVVLLMRLMLVG